MSCLYTGIFSHDFCILIIVGGKGCWGVKISQGRPAIVAAAEKMFHQNHQHKKGYDQTLLIRYFQSMATSSMVYMSFNAF
jgi:hypothetical protein